VMIKIMITDTKGRIILKCSRRWNRSGFVMAAICMRPILTMETIMPKERRNILSGERAAFGPWIIMRSIPTAVAMIPILNGKWA